MIDTESVIVGGGPAGAAAACALADSGHRVVLIERSDAPRHKVCGEFLSVETLAQLRRLGIDAAALGAAPVDLLALHAGARRCVTPLPFAALSLSRRRLDAALLARAEAAGAVVKHGVTVRGVARAGDGWSVACAGDALRCRHLVLATGKWPVRGLADRRDHSRVGWKLHLRPAPAARRALEGRVELALLAGGYAGLELVEEGTANLCLILPGATLAGIGRDWTALRAHLAAACPDFGERLADATPLWHRPLTVACPAGGHLEPGDGAGVYCVGDRLAHIPPFTGDGLAIALASGALAAEHIRQGRPAVDYLAAARRLTGAPVRLAGALTALAATRPGRAAVMGAAAVAPGLIGLVVRRTRLPLAATAH